LLGQKQFLPAERPIGFQIGGPVGGEIPAAQVETARRLNLDRGVRLSLILCFLLCEC
jgi:hypothetical protein